MRTQLTLVYSLSFLFTLFVAITVDKLEEEEFEESDDDDDDDYGPRRNRKFRSARSRKAPAAPRRRINRPKASDEEEQLHEIPESDSDSDGDWRNHAKKSSGRRRRRHVGGPSKRRRTSVVQEDDEVARTARINSRTGDAVNYFEGDDDDLDSELATTSKEVEEPEADDNTPYVEAVLDYRLIEGTHPRHVSDHPYSDFHQDDVEFRIKWLKKSHRDSTWETWETLKVMKGAKRVSNYVKLAEARRNYMLSDSVTPEEVEELRIVIEENRVTLKGYEEVERVFAQRETEEENSRTEFLVKWSRLPYNACTWETRSALSSERDLKLVDDFIEREQSALNTSSKKRFNPFNAKDERPRMKRMAEQPKYLHGEGRQLRYYQLSGLNFLAFSWTKRNNVILADEMGLGKTLQTISFLGWLMYMRNIPGPFLVVVPLSTIAAWVREFARWLPDMNVICYSGDAKSRAVIREYEFWSSAKGSAEKFHVLLTTPELLMQDESFLQQFRWAMLAVDEAHRLKNETSALHLTLASLRSANRLLVTGTPLQNSVRELWALLHFLNPDKFPNAEEFEEKFSFSALRDPDRVSSLHNTLRPYIIRRQKSDVEKSLPKKTYAVLRVGMTSAQQQYYRWLLTRNFAKLNAAGKARGMGTTSSIRNLLMELKKCCNHPFLFPNYEDTSTPTTVNDLIRASGKMILLDKLLLRLREKGHRVLIFSQMVRMLDILQDYCRMRQFPFQRLDGNVANEARQRSVDHFNAPDSIDYIFLLSTRAGGLGINLATADTVIIFDSDWNPQNDLQAESRAHRIGQKKDVKVFRLLSGETVEEDILERAKRKRVLEHVVIHGVEGGNKADGKDTEVAFKKEELSAILRFGAEKLFAKDRLTSTTQEDKVRDEGVASKPDGLEVEAPTAQDVKTEDKDEKAEERRVLEADDIDELLARAPVDESSQVGAAQPSIGASLLNAFKWNDFKAVEEEESEDQEEEQRMAKEAASRMVAIDTEVAKAKDVEEKEKTKHAKEGDAEFWDRVIPGELRDEAIANDVVLGTRRRKRTTTFGADSPKGGKRRRTTRAARHFTMKVTDVEELFDKEQRSLLRSLRKFGDPVLVEIILKDSGLHDRIEEDFAKSLLDECLGKAQAAIDIAHKTRIEKSKKRNSIDNDPGYASKEEAKPNGKESKGKVLKVPFDILGEKGVDAVDLLKRCEDLQMLHNHIKSFDVDTQFRLRHVIKPPSYTVRWKPANDAMLLVGVYRHGFGNWTQIANDKQLSLGDKMSVAGNTGSKPGSPDTTKLTRRVTTLLRELEREIHAHSSSKKFREKRDKRTKSKKGKGSKPQKPISKKKKSGSAAKRRGASTGRQEGFVSEIGNSSKGMRLALRQNHFITLRELRRLSKESGQLDNTEKIKRTKQCLLKLGCAIDKQCESSEETRQDLWRYIHEVCRTSLAGDRLQAIYGKLSSALVDHEERSH